MPDRLHCNPNNVLKLTFEFKLKKPHQSNSRAGTKTVPCTSPNFWGGKIILMNYSFKHNVTARSKKGLLSIHLFSYDYLGCCCGHNRLKQEFILPSNTFQLLLGKTFPCQVRCIIPLACPGSTLVSPTSYSCPGF